MFGTFYMPEGELPGDYGLIEEHMPRELRRAGSLPAGQLIAGSGNSAKSSAQLVCAPLGNFGFVTSRAPLLDAHVLVLGEVT